MVATKQVRDVSPLPPGRYWLTVNGALNIRDFDQWRTDMAGAVILESSETEPGLGSMFAIFRVPEGRAPFLNAAQFGFPNTAPPEVRSSSDVEQIPEPEGLQFPSFGQLSPVLLVLLLVVLATSGSGSFLTGGSRRRTA